MQSLQERADDVLEQAREIAGRVENWADYSNLLFAQKTGIVAQAFPTHRERTAFMLTPQYAELYSILHGLMEKFGMVEGGKPKLTAVPDDSPRNWQRILLAQEQRCEGCGEGPVP